MKRTLSFLIVAAVMVAVATPSFAYPRPVEKLKGGLMTVVKSPLEVRDYTMAETKDAKFLPFAFVGGALKGSFYMVKKMAHGAWDIATFPIVR